MATNYLAEAFQQMKLLESETFSFDNDGAAKLSNFMDDDLLTDVEVVIDPEAETEEDLKDSYIGDIILACEVCHSMIYKREEEVTVEEDADMANVGELCPYCYSSDGFKIIGKVAPYEEITVETESGEDVKVEVDGKKVETEADDKDEVKDLDPETEEDKLKESLTEYYDEDDESFEAKPTKKVIQKILSHIKPQGGNIEEAKIIANALAQSCYKYNSEKIYDVENYDHDLNDKDDFLPCVDYYLKQFPEALSLFSAYYASLLDELDESVKNSKKASLKEAKEPLSVRLKKRLAMKAENLEEEVIEENFYAVVEVDGEERRFPFADRDKAREYLAYVRKGAPEFKGKKIGSMWTESLDAEGKPLKEGSSKNKFTYDEAVNYLESKGISCDPTAAGCGEFVCDLLDEYVDDYNDYDEEIYYKSTLDDIIDRAKDYLENPEEDLDESVTKKNSKQNLKEGMEDISITTETDVIKVKATPREDKEAIVPMQPEEVQELI